MKTIRSWFQFGEEVADYPVRVVNERESRAAAGMLFTLAFFAFMQAFLTADFSYERIMIVILGTELAIRVIFGPKFAPFMILARLVTRNQEVEYTGAPQKRVAWGLGLAIAVFMYWLVFVDVNLGLANFIGCITCVTLLFFESAFGICIGCVLYNWISHQKAQLCPGGACRIKRIEPIQHVNWFQIMIVLAFIATVFSILHFNLWNIQNPQILTPENFDTYDFSKYQ